MHTAQRTDAMVYVRKILAASVTLVFLLVLAFVAMRVVPGDPVALLVGDISTPEDVARIKAKLHLDEPIFLQLLRYAGDVVRGDLGKSLRTGLDVKHEISRRVGRTAALAAAALIVGATTGVVLGTLAAFRAGSWVDNVISGISILGLSTPIYWSGLLMIYVFGLTLGWLPTGGHDTPRHIILPALTLGFYQSGAIAVVTRGHVLDVIHQDHVRTARAKGLGERRVMLVHVLRVGMVPIVALMAVQFGRAFGGAAVTETVFSWAGIGRLLVEATSTRDFPMVQALLLFFGSVFLMVNMLTELLYVWIDPRARQ
jgi:peptide/nickel transport system permease protein